MPDPLPLDIGAGAVPRDPACHVCGHAHHLIADCDWCPCSGDLAPGL